MGFSPSIFHLNTPKICVCVISLTQFIYDHRGTTGGNSQTYQYYSPVCCWRFAEGDRWRRVSACNECLELLCWSWWLLVKLSVRPHECQSPQDSDQQPSGEKREIIGFSRKCNNNPPKPQKCVSVVKFEINHVKRVIYCTKTPTSHFFLEHFMATEKGPVADWKWISPSKSTSSYDKYWIFITVEHSLIIFIIFKEGKKNIVEQDWNDNHLRCKNLSCKGHLRF